MTAHENKLEDEVGGKKKGIILDVVVEGIPGLKATIGVIDWLLELKKKFIEKRKRLAKTIDFLSSRLSTWICAVCSATTLFYFPPFGIVVAAILFSATILSLSISFIADTCQAFISQISRKRLELATEI